MIKYSGRPFADADEMDQAMISRYQSVVKPHDVVIWCGDISFRRAAQTNDILNQLPGYKILVVGNHDINRKTGNVEPYDVDEIHLSIAFQWDGITYIVTHHPLTVVPAGCINIHGHIHNLLATNLHANVAVEHTNYGPIGFDLIHLNSKRVVEQ